MLDQGALAGDLRAFLAPADGDLPASAPESARLLADAYARYLLGAAPPLVPAGVDVQKLLLVEQLTALYDSAGGAVEPFLAAFVSFWSPAVPPTLVAGAAAIVAAGFAPAASAVLTAAMAAAQAGATDFPEQLAAALHAGTLAVAITTPAGTPLVLA